MLEYKRDLLESLDEKWYLQTYLDVIQTGMTAKEHFEKYGIRLGRKPCADQTQEQLNHNNKRKIQVPYFDFNQITPSNLGSHNWLSQGDDPFFLIDLDLMPVLQPGWYSLDIVMNIEHKQGLAKLYMDTGSGFNELEIVSLPYKNGAEAQRLFYLKSGLVALRFDPKEQRGSFSINRFEINPVSNSDVEKKCLTRISLVHQAYRSKKISVIRKEILKETTKNKFRNRVLSIYNETFSFTLPSIDYEEWIESVEQISLPSRELASLHIGDMSYKPVISIVMPVYNPQDIYLRACIDSVLAQSYPYWELCIADDKSPNANIEKTLKEYEIKDSRIRVNYRKENGHISAASNSALELAQGDYIALLDHDDVLPEHALFYVAQKLNNQPELQIIYSDEDKLNAQGERFDPHFKCDWNPDLFFSQNYVSHLGVYKTELLNKIGGFRLGLEGSQDQDLFLRCLPHVKPQHIGHIPKILYHWRTVEGSTALGAGQKSYTTEAGIKALQDYFRTQKAGVKVEVGLVPNTYRLHYPIPKNKPLVSLLIPTRDRRGLTETAVRSIIEKSIYTNFEIIILDNGSVEKDTLEFFTNIQREDRRVRVIRYDHPFNYSAINNFGVKHARGSIIGLINNDVEVINPGWLTEMVSHCLREEIGCVGAKLYYSNDTVQHGGIILGIGGVAGHSHKNFPRNHPGYFSRLLLVQSLSAVTAACLLVRKDVYEAVNGLDEENLTVAFNDVDFCLKVQALGYRNIWTPYAELYHYESISRGNEDTVEKIERFSSEVNCMINRWGGNLLKDPFYSANLTMNREDFTYSD